MHLTVNSGGIYIYPGPENLGQDIAYFEDSLGLKDLGNETTVVVEKDYQGFPFLFIPRKKDK